MSHMELQTHLVESDPETAACAPPAPLPAPVRAGYRGPRDQGPQCPHTHTGCAGLHARSYRDTGDKQVTSNPKLDSTVSYVCKGGDSSPPKRQIQQCGRCSVSPQRVQAGSSGPGTATERCAIAVTGLPDLAGSLPGPVWRGNPRWVWLLLPEERKARLVLRLVLKQGSQARLHGADLE